MADSISIYRRRPKCSTSDKDMEAESNAPQTTANALAGRSPRTRKGRASWIDRSLSSRGNINSFASSRQPSDKAKKAFASPNIYRKKRVEAPADFVREQKSYFEQVDAFELEEESPTSKDRWMPEPQQKDVIAPCLQSYSRGLLQAVQEDAHDEELPHDISKGSFYFQRDPLSHILGTPQSIQSLQKSKCRGPTQNSLDDRVEEVVHGKRPVTVKNPGHCKAPVMPKEPYPVIIISDDENEHFKAQHQHESLMQSRHSRRQAREVAAAGSRQTVLQIIDLADSPVPLSKDYNTNCQFVPVKCEKSEDLSTTKKLPANIYPSQKAFNKAAELSESKSQTVHSSYKSDEGLVEQIKKLEFHASKDESELKSTKFSKGCASKEQLPLLSYHLPDKADQSPTLKALLEKCGQTTELALDEAVMQYSDMRDLAKLGEGTYGEAFRAGNFVYKIVPMAGSFLVNGEPQKTVAEMHTEMLLTLTLNRFQKQNSRDLSLQHNICNNFVETKMVKVCKGLYGEALIKAWEEWDVKNESENDHPRVFPENQLYMLFVLADGGKDLESISIDTFEVARSILIQVIVALAIAEEDCEFEHRDLHWGNILIAQTTSDELFCKLDGTDLILNTCGVLVHIIDFTLSRLFTGKEVLFSDLSADPLLFQGPKGDIQAEVYRKMLYLTEGQWDKRFLKTNCYWIQYLVDILLTKKKFPCSHHESRALRAFKKRVTSYDSARACLQDPFCASEVKERR